MNTEEMRAALITKYDEAAAKLRSIMTDPELLNIEYKELVEAGEALGEAVQALIRLNNIIHECTTKS